MIFAPFVEEEGMKRGPSEQLDETCSAGGGSEQSLMWQLFYQAGCNIYHHVEVFLSAITGTGRCA